MNFEFLFIRYTAAFQEMFKKVCTARAKLEGELSNIYSNIDNSIDKQDRKVKIKRLIVKFMTHSLV